MRYLDRRERGQEKREAIRRHRTWKDPNDIPKKPNKSMRISLICIVMVIFFATAVKTPIIVKKDITQLQDLLVTQAIMEGTLQEGICRVILGERMLLVFNQDYTEFSGISAKVIDDTLFIKLESKQTEIQQTPIVYEVSAKELMAIELFENDINRPFDAIYMINKSGTALEDY